VIMIVYWIHLPTHLDVATQGYVGIASNFEQRMLAHKSESIKSNYPLYQAIRKYGWNNLIKEPIVIGNSDYCKLIENKLRPNKRIGWNLSEGGNLPPNFKAIKQSESHLKNRCIALKGRKSGFLGKKHTKESIEKTMVFVRGIAKTKECKEKISIANKKQIKINNVIYPSWQEASKITGIPTGSISYLLKNKPTKGKWVGYVLERVM